ncbi:MAG: hypothetical protein KatS3mg111_1693 [Pirellulaceae bacterium]|nr:MAG: hypothetical protein KatS3mg111_1693 [Pirellulaceae bacterium]
MIKLETKLPFKVIFSAVDITDILSAETELGVALPDEFRNFLLAYNGIQFLELPELRFWGSEEFSLLERIYGIAPQPMEGDIRAEQNSRFLRQWQVPSELVCFAEGPCSQFLFGACGEVLHWDSQTRPPENIEEAKCCVDLFLETVAPSFEQFLKMI